MKLLGYAGVWVILDEGHVTNILVHPKHRRKGIGRQLMEAITAYAALRSGAQPTLEVRVRTQEQNLYRQLGYEFCGC